MLEGLPTTLLIAAAVAVLLALYRRFSQTWPSPVAQPAPGELSQGVSILTILCVTASAGVALVFFAFMGVHHPLAADQPLAEPVETPFIALLACYIVTCAAAGFYEEAVFRVILQGLFERGFRRNGSRRCILHAALLGSAVFAAMHVASPVAPDADTLQVALQAVFKCVQGFLFGIIMVGLLKRTGSFTLVFAIHTCYNLLFFMPWFLATGAFPSTYLTGEVVETAGLVATSACLVPIAVLAIRFLAYGQPVQRASE